MPKHYLSALDLSRGEAEALLGRAAGLKAEWKNGGHADMSLRGKTLALVFEKPSLRTRVAFEAGMTQLGGHGSYLSANDIDMGGRESVPDVARNLSRWVQVISARGSVAAIAAHTCLTSSPRSRRPSSSKSRKMTFNVAAAAVPFIW